MKTPVKTDMKGLRDISTLRMATQIFQTHDTSHLLARFSRLDAERTRLERELVMWSTKKTVTEAKLAAVFEETGAIQLLLQKLLPDNPQPKGQQRAPSSSQALGLNVLRHHTVSLNY